MRSQRRTGKRPHPESTFCASLIHFWSAEIDEMHKENVRIRFIGRRDRFSERFLARMEDAEQRTAHNTGVHF